MKGWCITSSVTTYSCSLLEELFSLSCLKLARKTVVQEEDKFNVPSVLRMLYVV